jgi:hypothetical protein
MKIRTIIAILFLLPMVAFTQEDTTEKDSVKSFRIVPFPIVGYDADMGFQFGALAQAFLYGDGSTYPEYKHMFFAEASWYTKGNGTYQFFYDSKYLIPRNIRLTFDLTYLTEKALQFYGFNGYEAAYYPEVEDDESAEYISRVYYRHERKLMRILADFQGPIIGNKFRWLAGLNVFDIKVATVDIDKLNKGKKEENQLPDESLLYDEYVDYGIINSKEKDGGFTAFIKLGLVFDTRDVEAAPNRGIWSEIIFLGAPNFLWNREFAFAKLAVIHRQYISIVKNRLVFAYRLGYQGTFAGEAPFYIQPYMYSSFSLTTKPDGLGGARTLRGVLRNRVVGDGIGYGNVELRWKFLEGNVFKQKYYLGLTVFTDGGITVQDHPVDRSLVPDNVPDRPPYFDQDHDSFHLSLGAGLRFSLDENFVIAVDYGFATDRRDGTSGLYLSIGNIF